MATYRVVTRDQSGNAKVKDYKDVDSLLNDYEQTGVEEDSYTMRLHGEPVLKGLIGPMSEGKSIVRYESPDAFVAETEKWAKDQRMGRKKT